MSMKNSIDTIGEMNPWRRASTNSATTCLRDEKRVALYPLLRYRLPGVHRNTIVFNAIIVRIASFMPLLILWRILWYFLIIVGPWRGLSSACSASRVLKLVERILPCVVSLSTMITILNAIFNTQETMQFYIHILCFLWFLVILLYIR